jgi:hypothetical protein
MRTRPAWADRLREARLRRTPKWSQLRAVLALEEKGKEFDLALPSRESLLRMTKGWERGDHEPGDFYRSLWALVYDTPERVLFAELPPSALSVLGLGLVAVEGPIGDKEAGSYERGARGGDRRPYVAALGSTVRWLGAISGSDRLCRQRNASGTWLVHRQGWPLSATGCSRSVCRGWVDRL